MDAHNAASNNIHPQRKPGINRDDAAKYLGVSKSTIAHSPIPFTMRGRRAEYQVEDLDRFDESRRRDPAARRNTKASSLLAE